jgi:hypothetical protein
MPRLPLEFESPPDLGREPKRVDAGATVEYLPDLEKELTMGRGILLWFLGVPIPIILLLAMCSHH